MCASTRSIRTSRARIRALLDIVGLAAFIYFLAFVTFYAYKVLEQSIESNTHSISALGAPLAIPQAVWFAGFVVFLARRRGLSAARDARLRQGRPAPRARAARRALGRGRDGVREGKPRPRTAERPMTLVAILVLLLILVLAVPVAAGLGWLGLVLNQLYSPISLIVTTGEVTWSTTTSFILVAVPFYVLMGEIMLRTGMAERMYAAIAQWVLVAARRADAFQRRRLRGVGRAVRIERRDRRHGRHRRDGRDQEAQLQRAAVPRHHRGRRHARHPHSAVDQHGGLRRDDRHLDPEALSGGLHSGLRALDPVHGDRAGRLPVAAGLGRHAGRDELGGAHPHPARPAAAARHPRRRDRLDLYRLGDRHRGRRARHPRGLRLRGLRAQPQRGRSSARSSRGPRAPPA